VRICKLILAPSKKTPVNNKENNNIPIIRVENISTTSTVDEKREPHRSSTISESKEEEISKTNDFKKFYATSSVKVTDTSVEKISPGKRSIIENVKKAEASKLQIREEKGKDDLSKKIQALKDRKIGKKVDKEK